MVDQNDSPQKKLNRLIVRQRFAVIRRCLGKVVIFTSLIVGGLLIIASNLETTQTRYVIGVAGQSLTLPQGKGVNGRIQTEFTIEGDRRSVNLEIFYYPIQGQTYCLRHTTRRGPVRLPYEIVELDLCNVTTPSQHVD